jgi:hypothetical protein
MFIKLNGELYLLEDGVPIKYSTLFRFMKTASVPVDLSGHYLADRLYKSVKTFPHFMSSYTNYDSSWYSNPNSDKILLFSPGYAWNTAFNSGYALIMTKTGSLIIQNRSNLKRHTLFDSSKISNHQGPYGLFMQGDGNIVVYSNMNTGSQRPIWASNTWRPNSRDPYFLVMQDDGNLVAYTCNCGNRLNEIKNTKDPLIMGLQMNFVWASGTNAILEDGYKAPPPPPAPPKIAAPVIMKVAAPVIRKVAAPVLRKPLLIFKKPPPPPKKVISKVQKFLKPVIPPPKQAVKNVKKAATSVFKKIKKLF